MSQKVYCERCLEVIDKYEDLVIVNEKPFHYHCYEKELKEEKKKTVLQRFMTWRFINSGLIANIQALMMIILGSCLYIFAGYFTKPGLYEIIGELIVIITLLIRMYSLLSYEMKIKKVGKKSRILENKGSVLLVIKSEAIDLLKLVLLISIIGIVRNLIIILI